MKTRLYIFGIMTLLSFGILIGYGISRGINNVKRSSMELQKQTDPEHVWTTPIPVKFNNAQLVDSIYNKKSGYWMPVKARSGTVAIIEQTNLVKEISNVIFVLTSFIAFPILIVCFYRIINAIKSAVIFDKKNISRLRKIGFMFLAIGIAYSIHSIAASWDATSLLEGTQYQIEKKGWFNFSFYIYALISFLLAEAFSVGKKLKEEQDLTI